MTTLPGANRKTLGDTVEACYTITSSLLSAHVRTALAFNGNGVRLMRATSRTFASRLVSPFLRCATTILR